MPLAWIMGVKWEECYLVGELIGLKTIINEFYAYTVLADMKKAGKLSVGYRDTKNILIQFLKMRCFFFFAFFAFI